MLLTTCDQHNNTGFGPKDAQSNAKYIDVDGETIKVLKLANDAGYVAFSDVPIFWTGERLSIKPNNIKAIEIASGCPVMPNSVTTGGFSYQTAAKVICD